MAKTTKENKTGSFEESLEKLETLVRQLESGEKGLEESLALFEKGVTLAKELSEQLSQAKRKVEVLSRESGTLTRKAWEDKDG